MKKICLLVISFVFLVSCGTYNYTINGTKIKSVLAINQAGDTVAVPYREFVKYRDSDFQRYQFNNELNWNRWQYPLYNNGLFNPRYNGFNNFNPRPRPSVRPKVQPRPRPKPRVTPKPRISPPRQPRQQPTRIKPVQNRPRIIKEGRDNQ